MDAAEAVHRAEDVLDFWFPSYAFWESGDAFAAWMHHRMQGGVDERICRDFAGLTTEAARGVLDHWQETARGRLALLIALDQFPRSLWRGTPGAFQSATISPPSENERMAKARDSRHERSR